MKANRTMRERSWAKSMDEDDGTELLELLELLE